MDQSGEYTCTTCQYELSVGQKITATVAAEREACAILAGQAVMRVKTGMQAAHDMTLAEFRSVCACAAEDAIRARAQAKA
jgi:hypothetical protein